MSLLGAEGLRRVAAQCHANTRALVTALTGLPGVVLAFRPFCHEAVLQFDRPVAPVLEGLSRQGILGGYDLSEDYPELGQALLVCATEMRSAADIERYAVVLKGLMTAPLRAQSG
jgi:glycine dehydrogenase subunit 1